MGSDLEAGDAQRRRSEPRARTVARDWHAARTAAGQSTSGTDVTTVVVIEEVFGADAARQTAAEIDAGTR